MWCAELGLELPVPTENQDLNGMTLPPVLEQGKSENVYLTKAVMIAFFPDNKTTKEV